MIGNFVLKKMKWLKKFKPSFHLAWCLHRCFALHGQEKLFILPIWNLCK